MEIDNKESGGQEWFDFVRVTGWLLLLTVPLPLYYGVNWVALSIAAPVSQCITILLCAVIMWVFRLLPDFVPSVFLLVGVLLLGTAPPDVVFSGYSSKAFFFALSVVSLSSVIVNSGLNQRMLSYAIYKWRPKNKFMFSSIVFLFGLLATPFVPSANGRIALIAPFLDDALTQISENSKEHQRLAAALLSGTSLLSPMFLSAKSINLLLWGMFSIQDQDSFNHLFWMVAALAPGLILIVLFLIIQALIFVNRERVSIDEKSIEILRRDMPRMNRQEIIGVIALALFVLLIISYPYHHIEIHLISLTIFFALLFFNAIDRKQFSNNIDWGFLIFLGAMVGFTNVLQYMELTVLIANQLSWLTQYLDSNIYLFILLLSALVFVFRLFVSINTTVILLAGALIPVTIVQESYAWVVGFIILMMSESYIWPYQASYYMQGVSTLGKRHAKVFHSNRVYAINGLTFLMKLAAIYLSIPYWKLLGVL